jgi:uncharacterized protein YdaU (DUF1376 family)
MSDELRVDVFMPLYVRDFLTSTFGWTAEERGHYLTLLMLAWDRGGLPADLEQLERLSPGLTAAWPILQDKFPVHDDGQRRNARLEQHRTKCVALKEKRVNAAKRAAAGRAASAGANGEQTQGKRGANGEQTQGKRGANGEQTQGKRGANANHPTPTPTPTSPKGEITHTHTQAEPGDFHQPGWAADEWARFVAAWNVTERAEPWPHLTPPDGWVDLAASPGWLERAREALARLPSREYFNRPLPVTRFFDFVDRIRAGEFADPKEPAGRRARQPAGGNL